MRIRWHIVSVLLLAVLMNCEKACAQDDKAQELNNRLSLYLNRYGVQSTEYADCVLWCSMQVAEAGDITEAKRVLAHSERLFRKYGNDPAVLEKQEGDGFKSPTVIPETDKKSMLHGLKDACADDALWLVSSVVQYARETGELDFLDQIVGYADGGETRLNVAITRARSRMVVIRSFDPGDIRSDEGGPGLFKSFLRYADAVSSGDAAGAMKVLDSIGPAVTDRPGGGSSAAASLLESALRRAGFGVERDVGAEGCVLDLAAVRDGRRVLGIEVDAGLYAADGDSMARDCLRRRYLGSRGWKVSRLWTPMMWRDPEKECSRIVREAQDAWMNMQKGNQTRE